MQIFTASAHNFHATAKYVGATSRRVATRCELPLAPVALAEGGKGVRLGAGVHCTAALRCCYRMRLQHFRIYDPESFLPVSVSSGFRTRSRFWDYFQFGVGALEAVGGVRLFFCTCQLTLR